MMSCFEEEPSQGLMARKGDAQQEGSLQGGQEDHEVIHFGPGKLDYFGFASSLLLCFDCREML